MHDQTGPAEPAAQALASDPPPAPPSPPEARQRWRLVVGRSAAVADRTQRDVAEAWEAAIAASGLPVAHAADARARPRISFGAPLPVGMAANGELIDVVLTERWPIWRVRDALLPVIPAGWHLVELQDVWLAGPPLGGRVAAAEHRVVVAGDVGVDAARLGAACAMLLTARRVPRERRKGDATVAYDLRPLVLAIHVAEAGPPPVLIIRTRIHPELGTGRPDDVVAALGDLIGEPLGIAAIVRDRLLLVEDLDVD